MAVTIRGERPQGRTAKVNEKGEREYRKVFVAVTSNKNEGPLTVKQATGLPPMGSAYTFGTDSDSGARVVDISPRQIEDGGLVWDVEVTWSSKFDASDALANPLSRPSEISGSFARYSRPLVYDINGAAVINSAGDPFNPPVEVDDSRPVFTIKRNEAGYNLQRAIYYQDAVNSDFFMGIAPGLVKISNISFVRNIHNALEYYEITYEFECRREGWTIDILDIGLNAYVGGVKQPIFDANGIPQLLNGLGIKTTLPTFLPFVAYKTIPFAPLGLP